MKGVVITLAVAAAGLSSTEARLTQPAHTTLQLSEARRAVGGTSSGGAVVFAGGCASEQNVYVCDVPSDAVDIFEPSGETTPDAKAGFVRVKTTLSLSTARGWPTVCSSNGVVAVLGGGKEGQQPHSRALDLLDVSARTLTTNETSLSIGLWGQGCATVGDSIIFGGGKIIAEGTLKPSMTDAVHQLAPGADGKPRADGLSTVGRLSLAREASGTTNYGSSGIIFAGGTGPWPPISVPIVDVYDVPFNAPEPTATWDVNSIKPTENEYWFGAASWNETTSYILDNTTLYAVTSEDVFHGKAPPAKVAIPFESGVPAARMGQNGVRVEGIGVCFYSAAPSAIVCYGPESGAFGSFPCSDTHIEGAIAASGSTVFVAGGAGADGHATAVVDVFTFHP